MFSKLRYIRFPALSTSQLSCHNALHIRAHLRRCSPKTGPQAQTITILTCTSLSLPDPPQPPRPPKPPPPLRPNPQLPASPFATALSSSRTQTSSPSRSRTTSSGRGFCVKEVNGAHYPSASPCSTSCTASPCCGAIREAAAARVLNGLVAPGRCGSWIWCMRVLR